MLFDHAPGTVGHGKLEHGIGDIDSHDGQSDGSIHLGLPLVEC